MLQSKRSDFALKKIGASGRNVDKVSNPVTKKPVTQELSISEYYLVNKHPTKTESDGKDGVPGQSQNCTALLMMNSADYAKQSRN